MSQAEIILSPFQRFAEFALRALHATLLVIGFAVTLLFATSSFSGEWPAAVRDYIARITADDRQPDGIPGTPAAEEELPANLQVMADVLARRYRVARPAVEDIVQRVDTAARSARIDPLLVLAVIGIESRFNPYAESPFGAQGLMQIIGRFHTDKFTPSSDGQALLDPETNIRVGVKILREYLQRTGDLETALRLYGGEAEGSGLGYADRVQAEKERLLQLAQRGRRT